MNTHEKAEGIAVIDQIESGHHRCVLEKIKIYGKVVYLFKKAHWNMDESYWDMYLIKKQDYKRMQERIHAYEEQDCSQLGLQYLGQCSMDIIEEEWIFERHMQDGVFGRVKFRGRELISRKVLWIMLVLGLLVFGYGASRGIYMSQASNRLQTTGGEVYNYSNVVEQGHVYRNYYNVYVRYTVGGRTYQGYWGKTANNPKELKNLKVQYDPKHPSKIFDPESLTRVMIINLSLGGGFMFFALTNLISGYFSNKRRAKQRREQYQREERV